MTALDAYFGIEEWVYDPATPATQPNALNAYFGIEEWVYDPVTPATQPGALNAYFGIEEYTGGVVVVPSRDAFAYGYENTLTPPVAVRNAYAYGYENTLTPPVASRNAYAYGYENTITQQHPAKVFVYDAVLGWQRVPIWYLWTGSTYQTVV